ncbi:YecA family protein [Acidithiobacillus sp. MC6.1]|nr:YecA family protein [Acidithiobacillus sp. MC6.1]
MAISIEDLDQLAGWLDSADSPENCMDFAMLEGFLTATAMEPEMAAMDELLPWILDPDEQHPLSYYGMVPVASLVSDYLAFLRELLASGEMLEPVFMTQEGYFPADWCEGFMLRLNTSPWRPLWKKMELRDRPLFLPFALLGLQDEDEPLLAEQGKALLHQIVPNLLSLYLLAHEVQSGDEDETQENMELLTEPELRALDRILRSKDMPRSAMSVCMFDGFVAGLVMAPTDNTNPSVWLAWVFDQEHGLVEPHFSTVELVEELLQLTIRHYNSTLGTIQQSREEYFPVFSCLEDLSPAEWFQGFLLSTQFFAEEWKRFAEAHPGPVDLLEKAARGNATEDPSGFAKEIMSTMIHFMGVLLLSRNHGQRLH